MVYPVVLIVVMNTIPFSHTILWQRKQYCVRPPVLGSQQIDLTYTNSHGGLVNLSKTLLPQSS